MHNLETFKECELLCPYCSSEYVYHESTEIFERREDAEKGLHVAVSDNVKIDDCLIGNPSNRRNGLVIRFRCENCHGVSSLSFAQDKGRTLVKVTGEAP